MSACRILALVESGLNFAAFADAFFQGEELWAEGSQRAFEFFYFSGWGMDFQSNDPGSLQGFAQQLAHVFQMSQHRFGIHITFMAMRRVTAKRNASCIQPGSARVLATNADPNDLNVARLSAGISK